jgi:hypothetical protein
MNFRGRWSLRTRLIAGALAIGTFGGALGGAAYVVAPSKVHRAWAKLRGKAAKIAKATRPRPPAAPGTRAPRAITMAEAIYDAGLKEAFWQDMGWAPREIDGTGAALVRFSNYGGWELARRAPCPDVFGGVVFRMRAPVAYGDFLEVRLMADGEDNFTAVSIGPEHRRDLASGWTEVVIPMGELNPLSLEFQRLRLRARDEIEDAWIEIDGLGFTKGDGNATAPAPLPMRDVTVTVQCGAPAKRISPLIYGVANADAPEELFATAHRWGGNPSSRYNWQLGNAYNTASDWYFQNVQVSSYVDFLEKSAARKAFVALTVPTLGWVAKDTSSPSFPVSVFGPQKSVDPQRNDFGNGERPDGSKIPPGPQARTSVAMTPEGVAAWIHKIREIDAKRGIRSVHEYILDNEPSLWNSTHRDVHPEPLSYDELLDFTIRYATAIRTADPDAIIAGPAEWGWTSYFFSAKDAALGFAKKPDRRAHGDVPILAYYLQKLSEHEKKTGVRLLDVLDVHFYPQGSGIYAGGGGATDADTASRRIRSTRALWDPTYEDESWIADKVRLIPRLRELVAENYPGRGISLGEWNFGAETHVSGGIALAEALGRFAQEELTSAFYWTIPKNGSSAYWAFRAYRNFDGKGGHFQDFFVPTTVSIQTVDPASAFASRDESGKHIVVVALNASSRARAHFRLDVTSCGKVATHRAFSYYGKAVGLAPPTASRPNDGSVDEVAQPSSITVFDVELTK